MCAYCGVQNAVAEFPVLVMNRAVRTLRATRFDHCLAQTHTRLAKVP